MRLIDADKLYPDCMTKGGKLAISQSQIANALTVEYPFYQEAYQTGYEEGKNERTKGEWKELSDKYFHACSICNKVIFKNSFNNFCPNCGADMRNGGEEE